MNSKWLWGAVLALAIPAHQAYAQEDPPAAWQAQCRLGDVSLAVDFRSASGDAFEDDMAVSIHGETVVTLPVSKALYLPFGMMQNLPSACDKLTVLEAGNGLWLMLLVRDNRPSFPILDVVLFDPQAMRVVDTRQDIGLSAGTGDGSIKTQRLILRQSAPGRYQIRLIRDQITNADCDCADAFADDWMEISSDGARIQSQWLR